MQEIEKMMLMTMSGFSKHSRSFFVREPSLLPVFGKLGAKAPPVAIAASTMSTAVKSLVNRTREVLSAHGCLALKLSVVLWTLLFLAAVFFIAQA
ncbi:hypothetical protein NKI19_10385 [Mesorhizobium sp. M0751]|uniref:hypothetical protein n=1 Tax=unclassified Mesorhizobium TaxID=325217 RepID=UPI003334B0C7